MIVLNHLVDAWAEKERKKQFHPTYDYKNMDYSQFDSIEKEIFTGDFYIFNGQFLHTVTDYKGRLSIIYFETKNRSKDKLLIFRKTVN